MNVYYQKITIVQDPHQRFFFQQRTQKNQSTKGFAAAQDAPKRLHEVRNMACFKYSPFWQEFKMPKLSKQLGIGAVVEIVIKNLRPKREAKDHFPNASTTDRILDCIITGETEIPDGGTTHSEACH